jgi:hypothetical protein
MIKNYWLDGGLIPSCNFGDTLYLVLKRSCSQCWQTHEHIEEVKVNGFRMEGTTLQIEIMCNSDLDLYFSKVLYPIPKDAEIALKSNADSI